MTSAMPRPGNKKHRKEDAGGRSQQNFPTLSLRPQCWSIRWGEEGVSNCFFIYSDPLFATVTISHAHSLNISSSCPSFIHFHCASCITSFNSSILTLTDPHPTPLFSFYPKFLFDTATLLGAKYVCRGKQRDSSIFSSLLKDYFKKKSI